MMSFPQVLNRMRLFQKMLILLVVAVFVPVTLLGFLSYEKTRDQIEANTELFLHDNLSNNAHRLNDFFQEVTSLSYKIMMLPKLQTALTSPPPQNFYQEIEYAGRINDSITDELRGPYQIYVVPIQLAQFPNYKSLFANRAVDPDMHLFNRIIDSGGKAFWSHELNPQTQSSNFAYVRYIPLWTDYSPLAVLYIHIPGYLLQKQLVTPTPYPNYQLLLMDENGTVLRNNSNLDNPTIQENERLDIAFEDERIQQIQIRGKSYYAASLPIEYRGWSLVAVIPSTDLVGLISQIRKYTFWIVIISLAIIAVFLSLIVTSFSNPVKVLVSHMRRIRTGTLNEFPHYRTRTDEIGQLASGYNTMIADMLGLLETTRQTESEKRKLELQMLINQVNPHFLYNTLDTIKWKMEKAGEANIARMVTLLAEMLRFNLNEDELTTLEREVEHAKSYLDLELLRKPDSFQVLWYIQPAAQHMKVLKLLLQPIVENAVRHGMNRLEGKNGRILVSVYREEDELLLVIEDNGPGTTGELQYGIGLMNVHKRLQIHFGDRYGLELDNRPGEGFKVTLKHPVI